MDGWMDGRIDGLMVMSDDDVYDSIRYACVRACLLFFLSFVSIGDVL